MKLELLKKLTRLANHNPNENEANLAARRVAKMLEEADFKLVSTNSNSPNPTYRPAGYAYTSSPSNNHEWVKNQYTSPQNTKSKSAYDDLKDIFDVIWDEQLEFNQKNQKSQEKRIYTYKCMECRCAFISDSKDKVIECPICKGESLRM